MPVDVTINGIDYKNVKELNEHGVSWRPTADVIDKPTGTCYITLNGEYDVTKYAKVSVAFSNLTYTDLSVVFSQTMKIGATIEDIRNSITSATVVVTQGPLGQLLTITNYSTIEISLSSGSTVVAGTQTVTFSYFGSSTSYTITGSEGKAKISTSGTGFTINNLDSENKLWVTNSNLSIKIEADDGYRFFSEAVTVGIKQSGSYQDITTTRCVISVDDPQHVSVVVSGVNDGDEFLVTAAPVALSDCATLNFTCLDSKISVGGDKTKNYQTVVLGSSNPLFWVDADDGFAFMSDAVTVSASDGSSVELQATVQNKIGLSLYFIALKAGVTYTVTIQSRPAISISMSGSNQDTYSIEGLTGISGRIPLYPRTFVATFTLVPKSGYTLGTVIIMRNGIGYTNFAEAIIDGKKAISISGLSQWDAINLFVSTTKS